MGIGFSEGRRLSIPLNCLTMAVPLWLSAWSLLAWSIVFEAANYLGRCGILVGLMAACLTLNGLMRHHRRVILEVMSYEFRIRDPQGDLELPPQRVPWLTSVD